MKRLSGHKGSWSLFLVIALSVSVFSSCHSNDTLSKKPEPVTTSSESIAETSVSETEVSDSAPDYDPQEVLKYQELIKSNQSDDIPEDLVMKKVTRYREEADEAYEVETCFYEDGKITEWNVDSDNVYAMSNKRYEYSGDDLIRVYSTYGSKDTDKYYAEYVTEIEYGQDMEKESRYNVSGEVVNTTVRTYKDGFLIEETMDHDYDGVTYSYEYDGELLVRLSYTSNTAGVGWTIDYSYDDNGRLISTIREENYEDYHEVKTDTYEYDDEGVLIHFDRTFEDNKASDESYEDKDYEYIIDNGFVEITRGYVFDDEGNKTGAIMTETNAYDEHGWKIYRSLWVEGADSPRFYSTTENTYDDQGRIIKQVTVINGDRLDQVVEYEYR